MIDDSRSSGAATHAPLQARISAVALTTTVVALLAACLCFMLQQWSVARQESQANHEILAQMVAAGAAAPMADHNTVGAYRALEAVAKAPNVVSVRLTDLSGQVVAQVGVARDPEVDTLVRPVMLASRQVGSLALVARRPSLTDIMARDLALTGTLFFGSAGLAILLANGLARRMTKPMERLSQAMREVAADGRFKPVEQAADDDVFHSLTDSFNHLVSRLEINDHDLRGAMAELVKARDDANAANVLKSHFLANMSHEIRTPLNGVLAMTEVMAMGELNAAQRERLAVIRESGGLLLSVLNDVLDLSKIEAGRLDLLERDFDLASLALSIRESYATQARQKNLEFGVFVAPEALGSWRGDADRLRQILGNLVSNALKFTLEGSVSVRFASADDGSGLGLSICNELAALMGGGVHVQSREGQGSTFTVVVAMPRGEATVHIPVPVAPLPIESERRLRVLAADDNPTNQKVIAAVLAPLGAEVEMVADGAACVEAWKRGGHDIVLMDIHMPVMDGVEAARTIRSLEVSEGRKRIPIVAVTANALVHQVEGYMAAGMDGHVAKPIEVTKLYDAIETAVAAARRDSSKVAAA